MNDHLDKILNNDNNFEYLKLSYNDNVSNKYLKSSEIK